MTPAMASGCSPPSVMSRSSGSRVRSTSSSVVSFSPPRARRTHDRAGQRVDVEGVQRLAEREHDVVGDVDGERDRPHPHLRQPLAASTAATGASGRCPGRSARRSGHSRRCPSIGAASASCDGIPAVVGLRHREQGRVAEAAAAAALGVPVLAGQAAHREAVAAVGRDVGLDGLLAEAEQGDGVVAGLERRALLVAEQPGQHDDPLVVVADADLVLGADHPVGHPAVGLARGDLEARRAGRRRAARRRRGRRPRSSWAPQTISWCLPSVSIWPCWPDVDGALADRSCRSSATCSSNSRTRPTTSGPVMSPPWRSSSSRPTRDEAAATSAPVAPGREVGVLGEPASAARACQTSIPNCCEKRTSPSTISCMPWTPWRSCSARSMPSPKANPE